MDKIISARIFLNPILNISVGYTALIMYFDEAFVEYETQKSDSRSRMKYPI